jgi:hypothetical protein
LLEGVEDEDVCFRTIVFLATFMESAR